MQSAAAIILTGGASRRFGRHKPSVRWRGRPLVAYVLDATAHLPRVVVGRPDDVPAGVPVVREDPAGGGPVAGIAAGLAAPSLWPPVSPAPDVVVLLASDLPLLRREHLDRLIAATTTAPSVYVDVGGRPQWLCAAWPTALLADRLAALPTPMGASMRSLVSDLEPLRLTDPDRAASTDVDTPVDLARLEQPR